MGDKKNKLKEDKENAPKDKRKGHSPKSTAVN